MWAIIGGTGFEKSTDVELVENLDRETPFGFTSSGLKRIKVNGKESIFVPRHGEKHELLPSEVNYRANVFAARKYGAKRLLSLSAVGSLKEKYKPGDLVSPAQFIDRTKSIRKNTFCGEGLVGHVSLAHPACPVCQESLSALSAKFNFDTHIGQVCVTMEGPAFSTQAESALYRRAGAEIIGMTAYPEYALAREAGLCYLPCFFVTDYDCWDDSVPHVTLVEVMQRVKKNGEQAANLIKTLLDSDFDTGCDCSNTGLKAGLMTPESAFTKQQKEWLAVLCG